MKDELNEKLVEILSSIQSAAGKASDFAVEQLPDIAQSYIAYGRVYGTAMLFITLVFFLLCLCGLVTNIKKMKAKEAEDPEIFVMIGSVFGLITSAIVAMSMMGNVFLVSIRRAISFAAAWAVKVLAVLQPPGITHPSSSLPHLDAQMILAVPIVMFLGSLNA